ncbi:MAG TPA: DNA polymerase III subunit gamma/tau [Acidimicrobiales bacterium]|nr:DNA polymerase III subunit gamma/tau [Acidimicrobiales bacterium]
MADSERRSDDYVSLYRRFRPQRFEEVLGQEHVSLALRNAVRQDKVAHAYLFSGPRGTGKTSTARILAKALNCASLEEGEPCGHCQSCVEIARGTSLDVHELDAASNNGVDAMRDLVARAALGTPGRWKVYIVDEVHMLSTQASNALLKTLEEPPGHVVFVLATTDAQKVLPTVRSRTQHFEFRLLGPEMLSGLIKKVSRAAHLELGDDALSAAVRRGRGSARDALSALDQLAAAGVVDDEVPVLAELGEALADHDAPRALVAVAHAVAAGRDIHTLTAALVEYLRQGFLFMIAPDLVSAPEGDRQAVEEMARRMGLPAVVRAMESLGRAQVDMRDAPDPRVNLEATLIRLAHPEADDSNAAILERLERLERALREGAAPGAAASGGSPATAPAAPAHSPAARAATAAAGDEPPVEKPSGEEEPGRGAAPGPVLARQSLGALRKQARAERSAASSPQAASQSAVHPRAAPPSTVPPATDPPSPAGDPASPAPDRAAPPSRDALVEAWGDGLLTRLPPRARARFRVGRFVDTEDATAVFALPNDTHRSYCEEVRLEVEQLLSAHFATPVRLRLVVDEESDPTAGRRGATVAAPASPGDDPAEDDSALLNPEVLEAETEPAGAGLSPEQRLKEMFPGAEEV